MIESLKEISFEAGQIIKEAFGKKHDIEFKTNETNLVTETDKASEKLITDYIKKKFPAHGILAEEGEFVNRIPNILWVVDPLGRHNKFCS